MRLRDPKVLLALVSLGLVLWLVYVDLGGFDADGASPGPLTTTHARLPELEGRGSCAACHGDGPAAMASACADCHEAIEEQLASGRGLHGALVDRLGAGEAARCSACHVEHHGDGVALVSDRAFALAGFAAREDFDHPNVDFGLHGRHAELACAECHEHADAALLPEGASRFLGLEQRCAACHEDPHGGRMRQSCEACHGQERAFELAAAFEHTRSFALEGAHGELACTACHESGTDRDWEALASAGEHPRARLCGDCHESPHRTDWLAAVAADAALAPAESCAACHTVQPGGFEPARSVVTPAQHALAGFPLEPPHEVLQQGGELECASCHDPARLEVAPAAALAAPLDPELGPAAYDARFPGRAADDCAACHADPHGGQFEDDPRMRAGGCLGCHDRLSFEPPDFGVEEHARAALPLEGAHARAACEDCHAKPADAPRVFHGTPSACVACHADPHAGGFLASLADAQA